MALPSGFIKPCLPSQVARPPSGSLWVHEIKHDGYRLMVRRDASRIRCLTRNGNDWADRFPSIVEAAARLEAHSFLIDGEAVIARDDGMPDFHALRRKRRGPEAVLYAFDLLQHDGADLRDLPLIERKQRLGSPDYSAGPSGRSSVSMSMWQMTAQPCSSMSAAWALKASCRSGRMRPIVAGRRRCGSSRRTLRARRRGGSARRSGARDPPTVIRCMNLAAST
jgi:ATP dependent DNA ligase domain